MLGTPQYYYDSYGTEYTVHNGMWLNKHPVAVNAIERELEIIELVRVTSSGQASS